MRTYEGERTEPNAKASVEYINDNCVGITMEPIDENDAKGRIGIPAIVFHISKENMKELISEIENC